MATRLNSLLSGLACLVAATMLLMGCGPSGSLQNQDKLALRDALANNLTGNYALAHSVQKFNFPRDYAAHPEYRQEKSRR